MKVCNIKMDMPGTEGVNPMAKLRSSTSIVRLARRRIRTRENPSIDLHSMIPCPNTNEAIQDEDQHSLRLLKKQPINLPQIEPKPVSESQRTLTMPHSKVTSDSMPSHKERSQTPNDDYMEDYEGEEDCQEEFDDADLEVSQLLGNAQLINDDSDEFLDTIEYEDEKQKQAPPKTSQLKHPNDVSRRLVVPSNYEEGTMYIKAPSSSIKIQPGTPQLVNRFVMLQSYPN